MGSRILWALALVLGGCLPPSGGGGGNRCDEGEQRGCACPGDQMGQQRCDEEGRYGDCVCGSPGTDGASSDFSATRDVALGTLSDGSSPRPPRDGAVLPEDFRVPDVGRPPPDSGRPEVDFGRPERDFGRPERDFGRPERDFGRPERDFGRPERDFAFPRDAEVDAAIDFDAGRFPLDPRDGPQCREREDCDRACTWFAACFEDRRVCDTPDPDIADEFERLCREVCAQGVAPILCDLDRCDDLGVLGPEIGEQWRRQCQAPRPERDGGGVERDAEPIGFDAAIPPERDAEVPGGNPGNTPPDCEGGCEGFCDWAARCFLPHPDRCPGGDEDVARQVRQNCPAVCRNPGLERIACQFRGCGELGQLAGIIGVNHAAICEAEPPPDGPCVGGEPIGGVCIGRLSPPCHEPSAREYCAGEGLRLPTVAQLRPLFDAGWDPGDDYHTIAAADFGECDGDTGNVVMPSWRAGQGFDLWQCGDVAEYCNRAVVCLR